MDEPGPETRGAHQGQCVGDGGGAHLVLRLLEQLSQGPGPVQPFRVDRDLLAVIGRDDVVHRSDVTAWVDPDSLT